MDKVKFKEALDKLVLALTPKAHSATSTEYITKDGSTLVASPVMAKGNPVHVKTMDGTTPAPDGEYELEDGHIASVTGAVCMDLQLPNNDNNTEMTTEEKTEFEALKASFAEFKTEHSELKTSFGELKTANDALKTENNGLKSKFSEQETKNKELLEMVTEMAKQEGDKPATKVENVAGGEIDKWAKYADHAMKLRKTA